MNYSKSHQNFNNHFGGNYDVLEHLENFLGPNYQTVLNFWSWIDTFNVQQISKLGKCYYSVEAEDREIAWNNVRGITDSTVGRSNRTGTFVSTELTPLLTLYGSSYLARDIQINYHGAKTCIKIAAYELISMHILLEQDRGLFWVPMFENL
jgi:hypothetical protein